MRTLLWRSSSLLLGVSRAWATWFLHLLYLADSCVHPPFFFPFVLVPPFFFSQLVGMVGAHDSARSFSTEFVLYCTGIIQVLYRWHMRLAGESLGGRGVGGGLVW